MIRKATAEDAPRITEMGATFHAYSPWRELPFDPEATQAFVERLIDGGVVLMTDGGMVGGMLNPLYFSPKVVVAVEIFWWAPRDGRALREAFEVWAREAGAVAVQFSALVDERAETVGALFRRAGYAPVETGFLKRL